MATMPSCLRAFKPKISEGDGKKHSVEKRKGPLFAGHLPQHGILEHPAKHEGESYDASDARWLVEPSSGSLIRRDYRPFPNVRNGSKADIGTAPRQGVNQAVSARLRSGLEARLGGLPCVISRTERLPSRVDDEH